MVDSLHLRRWIHHFFVARVSPNRAGYPKRHVGVQLARSFACAGWTALALLRNRPVIVDRLPVGFRDVEATIMAAVRARAAVRHPDQSTGSI